MNEKLYYPSKAFKEKALIKSMEEYQKIYDSSIKDPARFWKNAAKDIVWFKSPAWQKELKLAID